MIFLTRCAAIKPTFDRAKKRSATALLSGNVIQKTTAGGTTTYTYDALDRIDTETGHTGNRNHDYDGNDNRTTDGASSPTTATYTPNSDRLATINGTSVTLDAAGNLTNDGTYKYTWDDHGNLSELRQQNNTLIASYYYDEQHRRTRKVTTAAASQGATKTFYHYDEQGRLIAETTTGNQPKATYVWNGDSLTGYITYGPRTVYAVQTDHLGSPYQLRTISGTVVWRWETEAYGRTQPNEDPDNNGQNLTFNLRFPGQYYDRESGLHYNWHRYYSPKLGRYISADPIGVEGGVNLYSYVDANPSGGLDPEGLIKNRYQQRVRPCNTEEYERCGEACSGTAVSVCNVYESFKPHQIRYSNGSPMTEYKWVMTKFDCRCCNGKSAMQELLEQFLAPRIKPEADPLAPYTGDTPIPRPTIFPIPGRRFKPVL